MTERRLHLVGWTCLLGMGLGLLFGPGPLAALPDFVVAEPDPEGVTSAADGTWLALAPPPRFGHTAVYDPLRHRLIFFGGADPRPRNDLWALDLGERPRWRLLTPSGAPPRRTDASAIYDPVGDRVLVFGGSDVVTRFNDVWELALRGAPVWSQLAPLGTPPAARTGHTAIYDPVRRRMIVFGGFFMNDVWELRLAGKVTKWTQLTPDAPPPARGAHTAIYDPVRDRMIVFGGSLMNDVWELNLLGKLEWKRVPTMNAPPGRLGHTAIYDPVGDRMLILGGFGGFVSGRLFLADEWELPLGVEPATWSPVVLAGETPGRRTSHVAIYDPVGGRMVVHGGTRETPGGVNLGLDDVWTQSLAGSPIWNRLVGDRTPGPRHLHASIYDPARDRVIVFGGFKNVLYHVTVPSNDVYAFAAAESPSWTLLAPAGPPPPRGWATAIHDPVRDRMVLFNGSELWELRFSPVLEWRPVTPEGTPPPPARSRHTAIYDPVGDRMVLFNGSELWELRFSPVLEWRPVTPEGTPPPPARSRHTAIYDPVRHRMLVFGSYGTTWLNDVWELSLSGTPSWNPLAPTGTAPARRWDTTAIYDGVRDRMVIFSGDPGYEKEAWALSLSGAPAWRQLAPRGQPPNGRRWHTAVYDQARDRMVVLGGSRPTHIEFFNYENAPYALAWGSTAVGAPAGEDPQGAGLAQNRGNPARTGDERPQGTSLEPSRPNPARTGLEIPFTLARPGPVELRLYDLAGRPVRTLLRAALPAGPHLARWDLRGEDGAPVRPGIYFYALRAGSTHLVRRAVVTR